MKALFSFLAIALLVLPAAAAEQKVAIVDLKTVYNDFWETKKADKELKARQEKAQKELQGQLDTQKKLLTELQNMDRALRDPKLGLAERQRRQQAFAQKQKEYAETGRTLQDVQKTMVTRLREEQRKMQDDVMGKIKVIVSAVARKGGYTLVVDKNILLFSADEDDLTKDVLEKLNANDPAKTAVPGPPKK
jgi:outer membrane protein